MSAFQEKYEAKRKSMEELVGAFRPNDVVQLGIFCGEPYGVMGAIDKHCGDVDPLYVSMNMGTTACEFLTGTGVTCLTGFLGPKERAANAGQGNVFYTPLQFTDIGRLVTLGRPFDYFIHRVGPMNERGCFSFSLTAGWEYRAIRYIKDNGLPTKVVFEVNGSLPRVFGREEFGGNELSLDYADIIVEDDSPLFEFPAPAPSAVEEGIAANVALLIDDKSTVQLGFGTIPMAIGHLLTERKELGIHTEMICDAHIDLIEAGSVTNAHKGLYDGLSVATFGLGTKRLHDWAHENKDLVVLPVEEVNSARVLSKIKRLVSVNSVLTVDGTGQACAHCLGSSTYSGIGGAFEFSFGAQQSEGGQSITCLPAATTLKDGTKVSNIVAAHPRGTRITLPEFVTDWVVTEYGAVRLKCMPLEQRAAALIGIAHPDFQEPLEREMAEAGLRMDRVSALPPLPPHLFSRAT